MTSKYPKTVAAVAAEEHSVWDVAFALADEIPDPTPLGALLAVTEELAESGFDRSVGHLSHLLSMGRWVPKVSRGPASRLPLTGLNLMKKAGLSYGQAKDDGWLKRVETTSLRVLNRELPGEGKWGDSAREIDPTTREQIQEAVKADPSIVAGDPETHRAVKRAEHEEVSGRLRQQYDNHEAGKVERGKASRQHQHDALHLLGMMSSMIGEAWWWINQVPFTVDERLEAAERITELSRRLNALVEHDETKLSDEDHEWLDTVSEGMDS